MASSSSSPPGRLRDSPCAARGAPQRTRRRGDRPRDRDPARRGRGTRPSRLADQSGFSCSLRTSSCRKGMTDTGSEGERHRCGRAIREHARDAASSITSTREGLITISPATRPRARRGAHAPTCDGRGRSAPAVAHIELLRQVLQRAGGRSPRRREGARGCGPRRRGLTVLTAESKQRVACAGRFGRRCSGPAGRAVASSPTASSR